MGPVDDRLKETIDPYINHPSFVANNDLLIILFDEAQLTDATCSGPTTIAMTEAARLRGAWKCGGRTVALFIGAGVKRGYQSTTLYHLEAFLRLSLEGLGVTDSLPGASAFAPNMDELFEDVMPTDTTPPTIAAAPLGGSFASAQSVTLTATDNNPGTSIYFTTNGSTPTSASTRYTAPISIATTTTLKFIAIDAAGNSSAIGAQTYTIASGPQGGNALPASWQTQDIGAVGVGGNASFASGTYSVTGAGADIWGTADALRYAYTTLNGDGQVTARVATEQNVNVWTKAGVMIRDSVAPGSRQALMLVSPGKGNAFQRRIATSGVSTQHGWRARDGALLGAPLAGRQRDHRVAVGERDDMDRRRYRHDCVRADRLGRPGGVESLDHGRRDRDIRQRCHREPLVQPGHRRRRPGGQHVDHQRRLHAHGRGGRHLGRGGRVPLHLSAAHGRRRDHRPRGHGVGNERVAQGRGDDPQRSDAGFGTRPDARQFRQRARVPAPRHGDGLSTNTAGPLLAAPRWVQASRAPAT